MDTVHAYNRISGVTDVVPKDHLDHPVLGAHLEEVRNGKRRGRLSEIVNDEDDQESSATRVTNVATPDKDKED